ncbi:BZ3500_MvSof-1268-A1-R1_Chr5-2g08000 [Microbotryum saponariae]|uniref:BZ3500_MvSof-1268-A1-R1_Chr5-2g08000 protein n=1 Tax=Microbotryum saponariae TaxID=289078 RepID=A0A2X0LJ43_9BASI|nr:BZ3500_MvSof-1268-A1-R1_Chr5-2g08000 [Microbotryum saponariae]SDA05869.1 BZ3501_MvSof-1269-A2-R1_Chr5-2g07822 [Microbotryum saponariae]
MPLQAIAGPHLPLSRPALDRSERMSSLQGWFETDDRDTRLALQVLNSYGITRDVELAFVNITHLAPHPDLTPRILQQLHQRAISRLAAEPIAGLSLVEQFLDDAPEHAELPGPSSRTISSTIPDLDELLQGGWKRSELIEIAGPRASGRHLLLLHAMLHDLAVNPTHRALYVHSGTLDVQRCLRVLMSIIEGLRSRGASFTREEDGAQVDTQEFAVDILRRLSVAQPTLSPQQALEHVETELGRTDIDESLALSCIVIDPIDALLGGKILSDKSAKGYAMMATFMGRLKEIASSAKDRPVVFFINSGSAPSSYTNSASGVSRVSIFPTIPPPPSAPPPPALRPSLGTTFTYLTDMTLWFTRADHIWTSIGSSTTPIKTRFVIELVRSRRGESGGWTMFQSPDGISLLPEE